MAIGAAIAITLASTSCGGVASRRGATVLFASGADLQSMNPLLSIHPLARQIQRYVLLTTLVRYDSALRPSPYLARAWRWSPDHRILTFELETGVHWHDGQRTTAQDVIWTLEAARDPRTGYPRLSDLSDFSDLSAPDESTVVIHFARPRPAIPDVLTDLAILPSHLLDTVAHDRLRQAEWNQNPIGNGPFRFVLHEANRRWVFAANQEFPIALGGPPRLDRFVVVVVDEPTTKLAALTSGELDFAGINPAHASFVRRDSDLAVLDYPLLFTYGIVFNTRRPPFDDLARRRAVSSALDRQEIVDGYLYGFGTPAEGPVPRDVAGVAEEIRQSAPSASTALSSPAAFELLTVGSGEAALEQMIQAQLSRVGFRATIRQMELTAFLDRVYGPQHDFTAAVLGVSGDLGLGYLTPLAQVAGMRAPEDPADAQRFFADSVPVAFLYHARGIQGANRRVKGVRMDLRGELATVHDWWVDGSR